MPPDNVPPEKLLLVDAEVFDWHPVGRKQNKRNAAILDFLDEVHERYGNLIKMQLVTLEPAVHEAELKNGTLTNINPERFKQIEAALQQGIISPQNVPTDSILIVFGPEDSRMGQKNHAFFINSDVIDSRTLNIFDELYGHMFPDEDVLSPENSLSSEEILNFMHEKKENDIDILIERYKDPVAIWKKIAGLPDVQKLASIFEDPSHVTHSLRAYFEQLSIQPLSQDRASVREDLYFSREAIKSEFALRNIDDAYGPRKNSYTLPIKLTPEHEEIVNRALRAVIASVYAAPRPDTL